MSCALVLAGALVIAAADPAATAATGAPVAPASAAATAAAVETSDAPAAADDAHTQLDARACADLAARGDDTRAVACYRARAASLADEGRAEDALLVLALADQVLAWQLRAPKLAGATRADADAQVPQRHERFEPFDLGAFILSGKGELVATSTIAGGIVGALAVTSFATIARGDPGALYLVAPVAGGVLALGASAAAVAFVPNLSPASAHMIRAGITLGVFDAFTWIALRTTYNRAYGVGASDPLRTLPAEMIAVIALGSGVGIASAFAPLPEAAGPAALTGMIWLPVLATLVDNMTPLADADTAGFGLATLVAVTANAGFASGVAASFFLPITRVDTWGADVGALVGFGAGLALATGLHAPNPTLGWGAVAAGTALGLVGGAAVVHNAPGAVRQVTRFLANTPASPDRVALAPLVLTDPRGDTGVRGTTAIGVSVISLVP